MRSIDTEIRVQTQLPGCLDDLLGPHPPRCRVPRDTSTLTLGVLGVEINRPQDDLIPQPRLRLPPRFGWLPPLCLALLALFLGDGVEHAIRARARIHELRAAPVFSIITPYEITKENFISLSTRNSTWIRTLVRLSGNSRFRLLNFFSSNSSYLAIISNPRTACRIFCTWTARHHP